MKKILLTFTLIILLITQVKAANIDILPTMNSKSNVQDRVWVGTFQIVWNDFMDKIAFNEIKFPNGTPEIVRELNKQTFTIDELDEHCYYKYLGKINKNTAKKISKDIQKKFKEKSDIINKLNLTPSDNRYLIYAMLKKTFEYPVAFDKLGDDAFRNTTAKYFGFNHNASEKLRNNVKLMFYNNSNDFAIIINTKTNDEVFLYKTANSNTFNNIYSDMLLKESLYKKDKKITSNDILKIPVLSFKEEEKFEELTNKRIKGSNIVIEQAIESINFTFDNTGVKLKSEAAMTICTTSLISPSERKELVFNDTFVIFLKEKKKTKPYFALRVHDIHKFQ